MSMTLTGLVHCRRCGSEHSFVNVVFTTRGTNPQRLWYCPTIDCNGHTIGKSLYWVTVESS